VVLMLICGLVLVSIIFLTLVPLRLSICVQCLDYWVAMAVLVPVFWGTLDYCFDGNTNSTLLVPMWTDVQMVLLVGVSSMMLTYYSVGNTYSTFRSHPI
jgi:hypothetical protein